MMVRCSFFKKTQPWFSDLKHMIQQWFVSASLSPQGYVQPMFTFDTVLRDYFKFPSSATIPPKSLLDDWVIFVNTVVGITSTLKLTFSGTKLAYYEISNVISFQILGQLDLYCLSCSMRLYIRYNVIIILMNSTATGTTKIQIFLIVLL